MYLASNSVLLLTLLSSSFSFLFPDRSFLHCQHSTVINSTAKVKQRIDCNSVNDADDEFRMWWRAYYTYGIFDPWKMKKFCNYLFKLCNTLPLFMHFSHTFSSFRKRQSYQYHTLFFNHHTGVLYVIDHEWNAKNVWCVIMYG